MKNFFTVLIIAVSFLTIYPQDTIHIPGDYSTIQLGINAASNGDIVLVEDGNYIENINFLGKAITVASNFIIDGNNEHVTNTIIDGSQPVDPDSGAVVTFNSGEDTTSVLCGFTITGGTGTFYGTLGRGGGGIMCIYSGAKFINNVIENNHVSSSAASTVGGGIACGPPGDTSWIIIEDNIVRNNSVTNEVVDGSTFGGGIALSSNARIINNIVENNIAQSVYGTSWGGGIQLTGSFSQHLFRYVTGNKIWSNKALSPTGTSNDGGVGGGLNVSGCPEAEILLNDIRYNEVESNTSLGIDCWGGGVFLQNQTDETVLAQNYIASNKGINNSFCKGAGIATWNYSISGGPQIIDNIIVNNTGGSWGGGLFLGGIVYNNTSLINNTICDNSATYGSAVYTGYNSSYPSNPVIINSILRGSDNSVFVTTGSNDTIVYSDIQGGYAGKGNIDADPLFMDTLFNLSDYSPCIGAGIDSIEINGIWYYCPFYDYFGNERPYPLGSMPDIGACENQLGIPVPVELTSFTATVNGKEVILSWSTATELNNLGFEIQRSRNADEFSTVGFVNGHGTTTEQHTYSFNDRKLSNGTNFYRLKQLDFNGSYEYSNVAEVELKKINSFLLEQNYPNPFNPATTIGFGIKEKVNVKISVFNSLGEEVSIIINREMEPGYYKAEFNASSLPSGVYYYKIQAGRFASVKKMILIK